MHGRFGDDVGVQAVAEVNWVDVVTVVVKTLVGAFQLQALTAVA